MSSFFMVRFKSTAHANPEIHPSPTENLTAAPMETLGMFIQC